MAYIFSDGTPHTFDSGYSSSSAKKEKQTGLLGSLKEFFKGKKSRSGIKPTNSDNDITDNYSNFNRNNGMRSSFSVSPYEAISPNSFFTNQSAMKNSDAFKPKPYVHSRPVEPDEPVVPDFEIPIASGPTRQSIVGLFDTNHTTDAVDRTNNNTTILDNTKDKSRNSSSVGSSNTPADIPVTVISHDTHQVITVSHKDDECNKLSPQCSDSSMKSEDPRLLYQQIHEKEQRRRVSLPSSIVSDQSLASVSSERGEDRRRRRRSGPKLIGHKGRHYSHSEGSDSRRGRHNSDESADSSTIPPVPPHLHGMHPYHMNDPRYAGPPLVPHPHIPHPHMPHPHMMPPNGKYMMPHPLYQQQPVPLSPQDIPLGGPHPQMYPIPYAYGMSSPVMFQPVMEETGEGGSGPLEELVPKTNIKVKRSVTMDSKRNHAVRLPKKPIKKGGSDIVEDNDASPKGFDDFNLY